MTQPFTTSFPEYGLNMHFICSSGAVVSPAIAGYISQLNYAIYNSLAMELRPCQVHLYSAHIERSATQIMYSLSEIIGFVKFCWQYGILSYTCNML